MPDRTEVLLEAVDEPDLTADRLRDIVANHGDVTGLLGVPAAGELVVSDPERLGRGDEPARFRAMVYATRSGRAVEVTGRVDEPDKLAARPAAYSPAPVAA